MVRMFAEVTPGRAPRTRHYVGVRWWPNRLELPHPTVVLIDEAPEGFYLIRLTKDGTFCGDTWHPTGDEARRQAEFEFDRVGVWREIPGEVSDSTSYVIHHVKTG
jgi:hypothetical protein